MTERSRLVGVWRRVLGLSWPLMAEQVLRTMMRTTDIIVTGLFSPADFARVYGLAAPFLVSFVVLGGALQGGSDTKTPFIARTSRMFLFMVGFSWVVGVYVGILLYYVRAVGVVGVGFYRGTWATRAVAMMEERGTAGGRSREGGT
ncbi:hypothetical protein [Haladaptatus sp. CMAA 1911]|uniref:hypothetical protein n=1 Tax=unclassified Haladaptatus TaxID=2622732 RepID=UPI003753E8E1